LVQFVEEANTINDFKNYLKEKNISIKEYLPQLGIRKFEPVIDKKNKISNKYSLTYAQPLPGPSQGTFEELSKSNEHFKKMASYA
jgi:hypothetical protein